MTQIDSVSGDAAAPGRPNFIRWLRYTALAEGVSFLVLLLVAMPLKYMADMPSMVRYVGSAHGALFVALILALLLAKPKLPWKWVALVFVASLVPFAPFFVDHKLKAFE